MNKKNVIWIVIGLVVLYIIWKKMSAKKADAVVVTTKPAVASLPEITPLVESDVTQGDLFNDMF